MKISDSRLTPTFELESVELALGGGPIVGIDEAGRGPWAGPVVAAAVILDPNRIPGGIADSKALDADDREAVYQRIMSTAQAVGVAVADAERIDRDNILNATLWAMVEAVKQLKIVPRLALVDGNKLPRLAIPARAIVKGDAKCLDCRRFDHRQGHPRPHHGGTGARVSGLRLRPAQGIWYARAQGGDRAPGRHALPPPLLQAGATGVGNLLILLQAHVARVA